jgi:hypothetical protein
MSDLSPLREFKTTASQAPIIVNGTGEQLYELWEERTGQRPPKDFSNNLAVQRGKHDEPFTLMWLEKVTGHIITERQRYLEHPTLPSISCTLDGFREFDQAVVEAKNWGGKLDDALKRYTPQVLVQMRCRGVERGILAVLGPDDLTELEVLVDEAYERTVWERIAAFQLCVELMRPPFEKPPLVPPELWKTIDLAKVSPLPNWGPEMIDNMRVFGETHRAAKAHEASKKIIKGLVPNDVGTILYGDTTVKRSRNGAITTTTREL